ncbi:MAG: 3-isopropylmalate dehydratase large subunit [Dethiosulfatibacter sp.]|nr:3-isopropylmalate dehydratase large subunit [Dethiosulfatibacter sp.]
MGYTIGEKIIRSHSNEKYFEKGDIVIVDVDFIMASDTTAPIAIKSFEQMNGNKIFDPQKMAIIIDHASPCPNSKIANLHKLIRNFAKKEKIFLYDVGEGICHQLMYEKGHASEGKLIVGADSHTCTYGALGAFATGVGSTDLAAIMLTGKTWMMVPASIRINITGNLREGVFAKDFVLFLTGLIGANGANYKLLEFGLDNITNLSIDEKLTISNMSIEMGAKAGIFESENMKADEEADYESIINIDLSRIEPMIAAPHQVDNVFPVSKYKGMKIDQVFIGSCTNGRFSDFEEVAKILKGNKISPDIRLIAAPASKATLNKLSESGILKILLDAGATIITPGCGPCVGTLGGIPADGEKVLSTTNRNFLGRMGNKKSEIYLCSPAIAAKSALMGEIADLE